MAIPQNYIDDLLARVDIVSVVDARVKLKKAGKNYNACCPFHDEKTPSFTINEADQFYYCFGCGASGNAIGFVMNYESLGFTFAVEKLAALVGMPKHEEQYSAQKQNVVGAKRRELERKLAEEKYFLKFYKASIDSGTTPSNEDVERAELAAKNVTLISDQLSR